MSALGALSESKQKGMNLMKTLFQSLAALGLLFSAAACNTIEGVGKDTESAGEVIQDSANSVEEELDN